MTKVEGAMGSTTKEAKIHKELKILEVHKEPEMNSRQSMTSSQE
jgi:hypothetical protein